MKDIARLFGMDWRTADKSLKALERRKLLAKAGPGQWRLPGDLAALA